MKKNRVNGSKPIQNWQNLKTGSGHLQIHPIQLIRSLVSLLLSKPVPLPSLVEILKEEVKNKKRTFFYIYNFIFKNCKQQEGREIIECNSDMSFC